VATQKNLEAQVKQVKKRFGRHTEHVLRREHSVDSRHTEV
jgi:hypothetical protein